MATNYPGALDNGTTLPNPSGGNFTNSPSLAGISDNEHDAIIATQTKLGTGASTPANNTFLIGNGAGSSTWGNTVPTGTVVGTSDIQTLTNKTLTSPTLTAPTITNATISADAITGFSTSNSGTIYGISVTTGNISGSALSAGTVGSTALATNAVQANQLATSAILLGYTQTTSNFTTASATAVQVTGMTVTVTVPAGSRRTKVTVYCPILTNGTGSTVVTLTLWDGTVGSGTQLQAATTVVTNATFGEHINMVWTGTPAAGSKTYNVGVAASTGGGTVTFTASSIAPSFILAEAL